MEFKIGKLNTDKNRIYKILGAVLIVVGVIGITYPFWNISLAPTDNPLEELGQSEVQLQSTATESPTPSNTVKSQPVIQNRLIVKSAGVNMPIFLSTNEKVLLKGGWMYSGNSTPDKGGNTVIFGHRWLYKPPIQNTFYNLNKTKIGDKFSISWNGTTYNYQVSDIKIIEPTEISILNPTDSAQVTLITCTPLFSTKQRLVVIGKLI
ncbi:MAG: sortase [Patescibacteria group bacterium]